MPYYDIKIEFVSKKFQGRIFEFYLKLSYIQTFNTTVNFLEEVFNNGN